MEGPTDPMGSNDPLEPFSIFDLFNFPLEAVDRLPMSPEEREALHESAVFKSTRYFGASFSCVSIAFASWATRKFFIKVNPLRNKQLKTISGLWASVNCIILLSGAKWFKDGLHQLSEIPNGTRKNCKKITQNFNYWQKYYRKKDDQDRWGNNHWLSKLRSKIENIIG